MRYGEQWLKWFEDRIRARKIDALVVKGETLFSDGIRTGQFLDAHNTNYWKLTQLANVVALMHSGSIKDGDKIFDFDLWHSGLEAIPYITTLTRQNIEIYGMFHAGTYDESDYIAKQGMGYFGENFERCILDFVKCAFVGSNYHYHMLKGMRGGRVKMTGFPLNQAEIIQERQIDGYMKQKIIVNTSRLSEDKNVHIYKAIKDRVLSNSRFNNVKFVETHGMNLTKDQYYDLLARAKMVISTAEHENFGIGVIEAMTLNCYPIVPNDLSYTDYVPEDARYNTVDEAVNMIMSKIDYTLPDVTQFVQKYNYSIDGMLDAMGYKSDYL